MQMAPSEFNVILKTTADEFNVLPRTEDDDKDNFIDDVIVDVLVGCVSQRVLKDIPQPDVDNKSHKG